MISGTLLENIYTVAAVLMIGCLVGLFVCAIVIVILNLRRH
ncbi:hypothetical protein [Lacticaseibacillus sharpeae]|nr:hypothetical protein [Lacticaseibacillus sharpeae]